MRRVLPSVLLASFVILSTSSTSFAGPLTLVLTNRSQSGGPGDTLTFYGVVTNTLADQSLHVPGWGLGTDSSNVSGYPVFFQFTSEWSAFPKTFAPLASTGEIPLFTGVIASDFFESRIVLGHMTID